MNIKIIASILLLLFVSANMGQSKPRKRSAHKAKAKVEQVASTAEQLEAFQEIDNYDFLYANGGESLDYNAGLVNTIMDEAMSHIGARYRSGSKGPKAFDCSGFTSYVFGRSGMQIGCSSRDQYARNQPISRSEMQRGDLVFFTSPGSGRNVGHVGIVVDVDPMTHTFSFIHASSSGGVKISQSNEGFYSSRYIGVRRVVE
jgi:cell wall-associated NlpC family hydrolase